MYGDVYQSETDHEQLVHVERAMRGTQHNAQDPKQSLARYARRVVYRLSLAKVLVAIA